MKCKPSEDVCLEHCLPLKGARYCEDGRDRCSHDFGERRETCFAELQGERRAFVVRACLDCGAWLPLGPSDEEPVRVEVRAAEIAAMRPIVIRDHELLGWRAFSCGDAPYDSTEEAGWLANVIHTHGGEP